MCHCSFFWANCCELGNCKSSLIPNTIWSLSAQDQQALFRNVAVGAEKSINCQTDVISFNHHGYGKATFTSPRSRNACDSR